MEENKNSTEEQNENEEMDLSEKPDLTSLSAEEEVQKLKQDLDRAQKDSLYQRAELENFKKRLLKDQESSIKFANERFIRELMSPMDLLEKALAHGTKLRESQPDSKDLLNFVSGVELTVKELVHSLQKLGVEFVGVKGEPFDPQKHEAVAQNTVENEGDIGKVLEVYQKGCLYQGRLISPARVSVGVS